MGEMHGEQQNFMIYFKPIDEFQPIPKRQDDGSWTYEYQPRRKITNSANIPQEHQQVERYNKDGDGADSSDEDRQSLRSSRISDGNDDGEGDSDSVNDENKFISDPSDSYCAIGAELKQLQTVSNI
jgi:hypothetical protein